VWLGVILLDNLDYLGGIFFRMCLNVRLHFGDHLDGTIISLLEKLHLDQQLQLLISHFLEHIFHAFVATVNLLKLANQEFCKTKSFFEMTAASLGLEELTRKPGFIEADYFAAVGFDERFE